MWCCPTSPWVPSQSSRREPENRVSEARRAATPKHEARHPAHEAPTHPRTPHPQCAPPASTWISHIPHAWDPPPPAPHMQTDAPAPSTPHAQDSPTAPQVHRPTPGPMQFPAPALRHRHVPFSRAHTGCEGPFHVPRRSHTAPDAPSPPRVPPPPPAAVAPHTPDADAGHGLCVQQALVLWVHQLQRLALQEQQHGPALGGQHQAKERCGPWAAWAGDMGCVGGAHPPPGAGRVVLVQGQLADAVVDSNAAPAGRQLLLAHLHPAQRAHGEALWGTAGWARHGPHSPTQHWQR